MLYNKPVLFITDQIQRLKSRGLAIPDEVKAASFLNNISYYRLRAYTYPFQNNNSVDQKFIGGISFDDIISLYVFDRKF